MGQRDTLLLGRISAALSLCKTLQNDDVRVNSKRVKRWAKLSHWVLSRLHAALRSDQYGV